MLCLFIDNILFLKDIHIHIHLWPPYAISRIFCFSGGMQCPCVCCGTKESLSASALPKWAPHGYPAASIF